MVQLKYNDFLPQFFDRIQKSADAYLENFDEHRAFTYLIAELFETTSENSFVYTDGSQDMGIDFYVNSAPAYSICQTKCPDLSTLTSKDKPVTFGDDALEELIAGVEMLLDKKGDYKVKKSIKRLRSDFQKDLTSDQENTSLTAYLAIFGKLSDTASQTFQSKRDHYRSEGVDLKLITWEDVYKQMHSFDEPEDLDFNIIINYRMNDILRRDDYLYVLANAFDFYKAFRDHEWRLFEWNVRLQLHNSKINPRIVNSLKHEKSQKRFHHFNNGLLITCKQYTINEGKRLITVKGPQIINGCQTVRAISESYENLSPDKQEKFRENTRVQVKILKTTDVIFIGELVVSTNDQNPMNPRNLKSNSQEQRHLQAAFRSIEPSWFYQRKDGEFKSLLAHAAKVKWFRKSEYAVSRKKSRQIDNEDLAKSWFAFIGRSDRALRGGIEYFDDGEEKGAYGLVFKSTPSHGFWQKFASANYTFSEDDFEPGSPSAYQYLLSQVVFAYIDGRRKSFHQNRREAIIRGVEADVIEWDDQNKMPLSPVAVVDDFLAKDTEYFLNTMINNMREILVELFSFILCVKYGDLDAETSSKILSGKKEKEFLASGFDMGVFQTDGGSEIFPDIYDFLKYCMQQFSFEYEAQLRAAPRLKSYLVNAGWKLTHLPLSRVIVPISCSLARKRLTIFSTNSCGDWVRGNVEYRMVCIFPPRKITPPIRRGVPCRQSEAQAFCFQQSGCGI